MEPKHHGRHLPGSGGITIPNGSNDLYICKQGFPVQAGATYTVSAYYFNEYDAGYGGLGFTTLTSGTINGGYCTPLSAIGVSFHGGGGYMDNNSATTSSATTENWNTSYATVTSWFYFKETLNFTGSNTFSQTFEICTYNYIVSPAVSEVSNILCSKVFKTFCDGSG